MSLATHTSKPARRDALERPFRVEQEAAAERAMQRGVMPKGLSGLVRWFRDCLESETPTTIHKSEVWRDHGEHAEGGSKLGTPAWSEPFRRFIAGSEHEADIEGYFARPTRAALARLSRRYPLTAQHLFRLALVQCDLHRHAGNIGWSDEEVGVFMTRALFMLYREWSPMVVRLQ